MRVLLDTNIVIHRENSIISNYSIGHLFRWLDKLKVSKVIHPFSVNEINKYKSSDGTPTLKVKLESYDVLKTIKEPEEEFLSALSGFSHTDNDYVDNCLLYEVYLGRVDVLITEDRKMLHKANKIGIANKVFSINQFISKASEENPEQVDYKMLAVTKEHFGNIDLSSSFFDSFRRDYKEFDSWFYRKCDEIAYICKDDKGDLLGFLYLKLEDEKENYSDITPLLRRAKRLKVGTFKVESTGFRLGERFIKIIFDNALLYNVDEIYVTLFNERDELLALNDLLKRWGFGYHGTKNSDNGEEAVLVKKLGQYDTNVPTKQNYPNMLFNRQKFILPIYPQYHTTLLPDSKLNNESEENFVDMLPHRYALQKVYISWAPERDIHPGDILLFYRTGDTTPKKYSSVVTTVGIIDNIVYGFNKKEEFFSHCQNRSVFSDAELNDFWAKYRYNLMVIKFIYVKSLERRLTLGYLWDNDIVSAPNGPRPFTKISDEQFTKIIKDSETTCIFCKTSRN